MATQIPAELPENLSAEAALARLKEGNERYRNDKAEHPRSDSERRQALVDGQQPFVTVITCADSRVAPELVFDEGLGDIFVIRVAGNIADDAILGSIEYASLFLGVRLIVVMGHQSCGAVGAAVGNVDHEGPATHNHIDSLIDAIRPAVIKAREDGEDDLLERSVRTNASMVADSMRESEPVLAHLQSLGVTVAAAYYKLDGGEVQWL